MKKTLLFIIPLLTTLLNAQIGKVSTPEELLFLGENVNLFGSYGVNGNVNISYLKSSCDDENGCLYSLSFQNQEFNQIENIQRAYFNAKSEELEYLFNEMKKVFKFQEQISITIGKSTMIVSYSKSIDKTIMITLSGEAKGYFKVNAAGLFYLFGKKEEWNKKTWKAYLKS